MKEIKELNKLRDILCTGRLNIVSVSVLPNLVYRFNTIPIKLSASYFMDINKLILQFIQKSKNPELLTQN